MKIKTIKSLTGLCLLSIQLLTFNTSAFAKGGSMDGGGGNTLNGQLIEEYTTATPYSVIPDLKASEDQLLSQLAILAPDFGKELKKNLSNRTWYAIPKTFSELSDERTGLHFESEQPAYQNGEEIFVSIPKLNEMKPENRIALFRHEIIMTGIANKNEKGHEAVRKVMHLLARPEITGVELCNELSRLGFGNFMTKDEQDNLSILSKDYQKEVANICNMKTDLKESHNKISDIESQLKRMLEENSAQNARLDKVSSMLMLISIDGINEYDRNTCKQN
jgi:hypothetical protein